MGPMHRLNCLTALVIVGVLGAGRIPSAAGAPAPRSATGSKAAMRHPRRSTGGALRARAQAARVKGKKPSAPRVEKVALEISDLQNSANAQSVSSALCEVPGVQSAVIDVRIGLAVVDFDPSRARLPQFLAVCRNLGYPAEEYRVENRFPKPIKLKGG